MFIHKSVFIITSEGDIFKGKGFLHRMKEMQWMKGKEPVLLEEEEEKKQMQKNTYTGAL